MVSAQASQLTSPLDARETVVLLHGLGLNRWAMWRIERGLKRDGYRVLNFSYPSRTMPLEQLGGEWLPARLQAHGVAAADRLHFVTHSMGGIILRVWRAKGNSPDNLGHVVMLAPPNQGSEIVDHALRFPPFHWIASVNGPRLGTGKNSVPRALGRWPDAPGKLGVLAGDFSLDFILARWLEGPNDGKVRVVSTKLDGMADFKVLHASHTFVQWRSDTLREVRTFLRTGRFAESFQR